MLQWIKIFFCNKSPTYYGNPLLREPVPFFFHQKYFTQHTHNVSLCMDQMLQWIETFFRYLLKHYFYIGWNITRFFFENRCFIRGSKMFHEVIWLCFSFLKDWNIFIYLVKHVRSIWWNIVRFLKKKIERLICRRLEINFIIDICFLAHLSHQSPIQDFAIKGAELSDEIILNYQNNPANTLK